MPEFPLNEETLLPVLLDPARRERLIDELFGHSSDEELAMQVKALAASCQASPDLLRQAAEELSGLAGLCELALAGLLLHPDLPEEARARLRAWQDRLAIWRGEKAAGLQDPDSGGGQTARPDRPDREVIQMNWRGFSSQAEWDAERRVFRGSLAGVPELVLFEGRSLDELEMAMREAIDLYLEMLSEGE